MNNENNNLGNLQQPTTEYANNQVPQQNNNPKKNNLGLIIGIAVAIILLGVGGFLLLTNGKNKGNSGNHNDISNNKNVLNNDLPYTKDDAFGISNDEVENLISKMKNSNKTIKVIYHTNWNNEKNFFELEDIHEIDLNTNIGYRHDEKIKDNGSRENVNDHSYIDFNSSIKYTVWSGLSNWKKETNLTNLDEFLRLNYISKYDYVKKDNVLYGIGKKDRGYPVDENYSPTTEKYPTKTTYEYSNKTITIPLEVISVVEQY